jgi:hypothetical protein
MKFRDTTGIVTKENTGDVQKEADVIMTALVAGYAAYHIQRKEPVLFTSKPDTPDPNKRAYTKLKDAVGRLRQVLGPAAKEVETAPSAMTTDPGKPDFIQGVYLMGGDAIPNPNKALGDKTKSDTATGDPTPVLTTNGGVLYKNIVTSKDSGPFHTTLYRGIGAYTGMADDNRYFSKLDGKDVRGIAVPQEPGPDPVVLILPDRIVEQTDTGTITGTKVHKSGIQQRPDGTWVRRVPGPNNTFSVEKRATEKDAWVKAGPSEEGLYTHLDIGPPEGPFPTVQTVMADGWADHDDELKGLHPRWLPPQGVGHLWGALDTGAPPLMPLYNTSYVTPTAVDLKEGDASTASSQKGIVGYTHGMIQAIYAAYQHGPTYRPYEVVAGDVTPKLASCFMCATFMDAAGYPANAVHIGSSDSWMPLYGFFDKHPLVQAHGSILLQGQPSTQGDARTTLRAFNRHWRERCFMYLFTGLGLLNQGAGLLFTPNDPAHNSLVSDAHKPAFRAVCSYLMENVRPDFLKMTVSADSFSAESFDPTGVAATLILDALTAHEKGAKGDVTDRLINTLPAVKA